MKDVRKQIGITDSLPMVLMLGGGTGSIGLNILIAKSLSELVTFAHIFHITGYNKQMALEVKEERYHYFEFARQELPLYMAAADVVVTRAGLGALSELSYLGKPTIVVPLPNSHQERNAAFFEKKGSVRYLGEGFCTPEKFTRVLRTLLCDPAEQKNLSQNISRMFPDKSHELCADLVYDAAQK